MKNGLKKTLAKRAKKLKNIGAERSHSPLGTTMPELGKECEKTTCVQSDTIGNIIVIFDGKLGNGGAQFWIKENIVLNDEQRASIYEREMSYWKENNTAEVVEILLPHKQEIGRAHWNEFSDAVKRKGLGYLTGILPYAAYSIIATLGSGNYIFDLQGHYRYPHVVSDFEFGMYREFLETLPLVVSASSGAMRVMMPSDV
jgi:hypothetical protein